MPLNKSKFGLLIFIYLVITWQIVITWQTMASLHAGTVRPGSSGGGDATCTPFNRRAVRRQCRSQSKSSVRGGRAVLGMPWWVQRCLGCRPALVFLVLHLAAAAPPLVLLLCRRPTSRPPRRRGPAFVLAPLIWFIASSNTDCRVLPTFGFGSLTPTFDTSPTTTSLTSTVVVFPLPCREVGATESTIPSPSPVVAISPEGKY